MGKDPVSKRKKSVRRLRATITVDWDANPELYGTDVPEEMIKIDMENASVEDVIGWGEAIMKIEVIKLNDFDKFERWLDRVFNWSFSIFVVTAISSLVAAALFIGLLGYVFYLLVTGQLPSPI